MASPTKLRMDDLSMTFTTPGGAFRALDHVTLSVPTDVTQPFLDWKFPHSIY